MDTLHHTTDELWHALEGKSLFTMGFFLPSHGKAANLIKIDSMMHELCAFNFHIL
jgi:hypothetical protein